jgi:heme/copper-type cytochrome/quinol oxidase subunit 2
MEVLKRIPWRRLALLVFAPIFLWAPFPQPEPEVVEHVFHLTASQFAYSPAVLRVNPGDRVTIELASSDVVHGLAVDGYEIELAADPGQPARISFIADKPGTYRFRCPVNCGNMHPFMIGKLQVGPDTLYWRAAGLALLALAAGSWKARKQADHQAVP